MGRARQGCAAARSRVAPAARSRAEGGRSARARRTGSQRGRRAVAEGAGCAVGAGVSTGAGYAASGSPDKAEQALKRIIAADPSNLQAFTMLGQVYLREGRLDAARE